MNIYILAFLLLFAVSSSSLLPGSHPDPKTEKAGTAKIVFRSTDGGQTWQDISKGLPENLREDSIRGNSLFANDKGLFLRVGNGLYHSTPNATGPFWTKEIFPDEHSSIAPGKPDICLQLLGCKFENIKRNERMVADIQTFSGATNTQRF